MGNKKGQGLTRDIEWNGYQSKICAPVKRSLMGMTHHGGLVRCQ